MAALNFLLAIIASYLIGSIPTSYIFAKLLKGIDIRKHGSGNVGATNLMRTVGKAPGIICLVIDALKGVMPVTILAALFYMTGMHISEPLFKVLLGLAAVSGHIWTVFLNFKGGKGVATTIGVFLGLAPLPTLLALWAWIIFALVFGYVSLSSIAMSVSLPIFLVLMCQPGEYLLLSLVLCLFIILRHRENIRRLLKGKEYKIGQSEKNK